MQVVFDPIGGLVSGSSVVERPCRVVRIQVDVTLRQDAEKSLQFSWRHCRELLQSVC